VEEKNNAVIRTFVGYGRHDPQGEGGLLNRLSLALHLMVNWFLPSQKLLRGERTGSPVTKVYDTTQTPYTRMLAQKDVAEQTKEHLRVTCAALDMTSLLHDRISWMQLPGGDNLWSSRNVAAT
jgi:hypothetical protein